MLVFGGAALVGLAAVWTFVIQPVRHYRADLADRVETAEKRLAVVQGLAARHDRLSGLADRGSGVGAAATLFALLEETAAADGLRERIEFMRPSTRVDGAFSLEQVEMRVTGVALSRLVSFLYHVETSGEPVSIRRMAVRNKQESGLDVDLIFTRRVLEGEGG
jgi:type II secretory pathway component PulM